MKQKLSMNVFSKQKEDSVIKIEVFIYLELSYALPKKGKIKIYKGPGNGKGSSLYRSYFNE